MKSPIKTVPFGIIGIGLFDTGATRLHTVQYRYYMIASHASE